jgi:hypothetical protein
MNKSVKTFIFMTLMMMVLLTYNAIKIGQVNEVKAEIQRLKTELAYKEQEAPALEAPYTQITDLSSVMYVNRVTIDTTNAVYWTDVNGISGFDVTMGDTLYRYVEGHIQGRQLALYAPYISYMDEWSDLDD